MNCATHNDVAAVAFCRTCGKPLCNQCTRDVRGVIYCESCIAARLEGTAPGFVPPQGTYVPPAAGFVPPQNTYQQVVEPGQPARVVPVPVPASGPNPAVAGILSGFFPFGVGAVYCSQYAKGLAHLIVMVLLIIGWAQAGNWWWIFMIGSMFFYVYQIIDSVRTAKAIQLGEPAPDPLGLAQMFGTGEKFEGARVPIGAAVLIGLGILFLINTVFNLSLNLFWPLILIALGVYLFARGWGLTGDCKRACMCERCRTRRLMWPAILVTLGVLVLLDNTSRVGFDKTWPALLLVIGVVKLMQSNASSVGHGGSLPPAAIGYPPNVPPPPAVPGAPAAPSEPASGEVKNV